MGKIRNVCLWTLVSLVCLTLVSGCSPSARQANQEDILPLASSLSWGMTVEEVTQALDLDPQRGLADGSIVVNDAVMTIHTSLPGLLGEKVPADLVTLNGPEMLSRIDYTYAGDDLDAVLEALTKLYGREGTIGSYITPQGEVHDTLDNPRAYPADAVPYRMVWESKQKLGDAPELLAFFADTARTGYQAPTTYPEKRGVIRVTVTLAGEAGQPLETIHVVQDAQYWCELEVARAYIQSDHGYATLADYVLAQRAEFQAHYGPSGS